MSLNEFCPLKVSVHAAHETNPWHSRFTRTLWTFMNVSALTMWWVWLTKMPTSYLLWVLISQSKSVCFYRSMNLLDSCECLWTWWPGAMEAICSTVSFKLRSEKSDQLDAENSCWSGGATYTRVADVAEIGAVFLELHSVQGSKVTLRALLWRTENSTETLGPI